MSGKSLFRAPRQLDDGLILPEVFRNAGFTTFVSGKWHNGVPSLIRAFDQAEAIFFGGAAGTHVRTPVSRLVTGQMIPFDPGDTHSSELFADAGIAFIKKQKTSNKPFFCYLPFTAPHTPHDAPQEFKALYDSAKLQLPKNFKLGQRGPRAQAGQQGRTNAIRAGARRGGRGGRGGGGRTANLATLENAKRSYADYYSIITHMDHHIGRVIQTLKSTGQYENTLIVFASDHGYSLGNHGQNGKVNLYEHGSRVMINLSGPNIPRQKSSDALVYLYDLFPTLCDMANLPKPAGLEGMSLASVIRGTQSGVRDQIFTAMLNTQRALRNSRWKILNHLQEDRFELFNLVKDPLELNDLAEQPEHVQQLAAMKTALEQARIEFGETPEVVERLARSRGGGGGGRGGRSGRGRPQFDLDKIVAQFAQLLTSERDSSLTALDPQEFQASWNTLFKFEGSDKDEAMTFPQLGEYLTDLISNANPELAALDGAPRGPGFPLARGIFANADINNNQAVETTELRNTAGRWSQNWDDDKDGKLNAQEIQTHLTTLILASRGPRPGPGRIGNNRRPLQ